jgi:flagellar assembly protein FliH
MSSSAPKRQPVPEGALFAYADAGFASGVPGSASDASHSAEERSLRQQAECFEQGRQKARQELGSELNAAVGKERDEIQHALHEFVLERQNYYRRVEGEVVELALAIARKILHREVQIDPQALAGIVRVTLEKLDTGTKVNLHVHPQEATDWRRYFACQIGDVPAPEVHEDPAIAFGQCRVETSLGSTEVGLELQLKEIETGLLDLLAERPGATTGSSSASDSTATSVPQPSRSGSTTESRG